QEGCRGLTLVELAIVVAMVVTLAGIGIPAYTNAREKARNVRAMVDIRTLEKDIALYGVDTGKLADTLDDVGRADFRDPWGNPYEYLNFASAGTSWKGQARKDRFLVPLNSTYDLYSKGQDGESQSPLTAKASRDDIVRANDGGYVGLASDY
ncbi:MAG: type IV pilin protein, partial [Candidatus Methylomirabilis sp.]